MFVYIGSDTLFSCLCWTSNRCTFFIALLTLCYVTLIGLAGHAFFQSVFGFLLLINNRDRKVKIEALEDELSGQKILTENLEGFVWKKTENGIGNKARKGQTLTNNHGADGPPYEKTYGNTSTALKIRNEILWTASSEFGTYSLCEQRRFRRACASAQSRQNLRCSLI